MTTPADRSTGDDLPRDAHLLAALRHAPDRDAAPADALSDAIRQQARRATAAPAAPATSAWGRLTDTIGRWLAGLARPAVAGALGTLVVAGFVGLMWRGGPPPEALPGADPPMAEPPTTAPAPTDPPSQAARAAQETLAAQQTQAARQAPATAAPRAGTSNTTEVEPVVTEPPLATAPAARPAERAAARPQATPPVRSAPIRSAPSTADEPQAARYAPPAAPSPMPAAPPVAPAGPAAPAATIESPAASPAPVPVAAPALAPAPSPAPASPAHASPAHASPAHAPLAAAPHPRPSPPPQAAKAADAARTERRASGLGALTPPGAASRLAGSAGPSTDPLAVVLDALDPVADAVWHRRLTDARQRITQGWTAVAPPADAAGEPVVTADGRRLGHWLQEGDRVQWQPLSGPAWRATLGAPTSGQGAAPGR